MTSSSAATRGITFLPLVVAGSGDRVIGAGERDDQRCERLGQRVLVDRRVGEQHLLDAVELGGGIGHRLGILAGDQDMNIATQRLDGGQRLVGGILQRLVVVLGDEERGHASAPQNSTVASRALSPCGRGLLRISKEKNG